MLPLQARRCWVRNPLSGAVAELSAEQYAVLTACDGCHTLEEHGAVARRKLGVSEEGSAAISKWLGEFTSCGLLTSLNDLVKRLEPDSDWVPAPFGGVVIRTCDRPDLLARALASAAAVEKRFQRTDRYRILDDSRDSANRTANRKVIADTTLDCTYCDLSVEGPLVLELRRAFPEDGDEIDWLLGAPRPDEVTYGRPVNHALLFTAGQRVLMLDDDALLEPRWPPTRDSSFAVSSEPDDLFCFEDRAELDKACTPADVDPIAGHLESLGEPAGATWARLARNSPSSAIVELRRDDTARFDRTAKVLLTQNHAIGDPGSSLFPYHLLTSPPASRKQLLGNARWNAYAFHQRHNWRGQLRLRLAPKRLLTFTTLAGLDNSNLLPPAVRAHRNEDLLLGELTKQIYPAGWFLDLPWGLPHWRSPAKAWLDPSTRFPQEPLHFLMDYLEQRAAAISSELPQDRMRTVGANLLDLAATSDARLIELLELQAADTASRVQFAISAQLDDTTIPGEWKDMLRQWLESPTLSVDPALLRSRLASPTVVRTAAKNYGHALNCWPRFWEWARDRAK